MAGQTHGGTDDDSDPETLKELLARVRRRETVAFEAAGRTAPYSSADFATNANKAGNLFRHYGIRPGSTLAVVAGPKEATSDSEAVGIVDSPEPLLSVFGGVSLGATIDLVPAQPVDTRAIVLPAGWLDRYDVEPGCSRIAYGGPPDSPSVAHFGTEMWSENPTAPPDAVAPDDPALWVDDATVSNQDLLDASRSVVQDHGLDSSSQVALAAPVTDPGALVAGVVAPLLADATVHLSGVVEPDRPLAAESTHVVAGTDPDADDGVTHIDPADVTAMLRPHS
jgi:hypothetical protein